METTRTDQTTASGNLKPKTAARVAAIETQLEALGWKNTTDNHETYRQWRSGQGVEITIQIRVPERTLGPMGINKKSWDETAVRFVTLKAIEQFVHGLIEDEELSKAYPADQR